MYFWSETRERNMAKKIRLWIHHHHSVFCLTTGPKPPPKRCLHIVRSRASSFKWEYDYELYETFKDPNIVTYIKVKRLAWAGNLGRMNNDRTLKKIFNTKPDGVKNAGRSKLRWEDGVDQDIRILGVKNWRKVAVDGDEWAMPLKKARAHQGLSSKWWWLLFYWNTTIYEYFLHLFS